MHPTTLTDENEEFKDDLCDLYGYYSHGNERIRCMLLNEALPNSLVVASHLFRRSNQHLASVLMAIKDIDDVRNGLLLFKPLKHAFDHFLISFIRDDSDQLRLKLFDPSIRDTRLIDLTDRNGNKVLHVEQIQLLMNNVSLKNGACKFDIQATFGDLDDCALTFYGTERPFYRCLHLQARMARVIALENNWIDESYDFKDFWLDVSLDDKMEMFHRSLLNDDAT